MGAFVSSSNIGMNDLGIIEYVDNIYGYVSKYENGVIISVSSISYKDNNPNLFKGLLKYLTKNHINGFKSIIVLDFSNIVALDPIPVISDSIDISEIAEGAGYVVIKANKDIVFKANKYIVFKEGTKEVGKSDKINLISSKLVDGNAPYVKVNGSEFESISYSKQYSFDIDSITEHL